jgi:cell division protein FtsW (lipid II flippase)
MDEEAAVGEAIRSLGDPAEIGVELDKRHKLETPWLLLAAVSVMFLFGISMAFALPTENNISIGLAFASFASISLLAMLAMMSINYQWLFKLRIPLYAVILALILVKATNWELRFYDSRYYLLALPLSGMLFSKKGKGWGGIAFLLAILAFSDMLFFYSSTSGAFCLIMALGISGLAAGLKKHFSVSRNAILLLCAFIILVVFAGMFWFISNTPYMVARIEGWLSVDSYQGQMARMFLARSRPFGASLFSNLRNLPNAGSDFVLVSAIATHGIFFGATIVLTSGFLIFLLYKAAFKARDMYGFYLALTCCNILAIRIVLHVLVNLNLIPIVSVSFPFVSLRESIWIVDAILVGAVLSVSRHSLVLKSPNAGTFLTRLKNVFPKFEIPVITLTYPSKCDSTSAEICPLCGKPISAKISGARESRGNGSRKVADS